MWLKNAWDAVDPLQFIEKYFVKCGFIDTAVDTMSEK